MTLLFATLTKFHSIAILGTALAMAIGLLIALERETRPGREDRP